jgi:hypothetical protein
VFKTFSATLLGLVIASTAIAQPVKTQGNSQKCDAHSCLLYCSKKAALADTNNVSWCQRSCQQHQRCS